MKKGDKSWTVKDNELGELPDEVRRPVESLLGRGPMHFRVLAGDRRPPPPPHIRPRGLGDEPAGPRAPAMSPPDRPLLVMATVPMVLRTVALARTTSRWTGRWPSP